MFTKQEVKKMQKGFHPSRTGRRATAMVGKGEKEGNRKERRADLSLKGQINFNGGAKMQVIGRSRFIHFVQMIPIYVNVRKDEKLETPSYRELVGFKKVSQSILVSKPNN